MKALRAAAVTLGMFVLAAISASPAKAAYTYKPEYITIFTFQHPVEIPGGQMLPAGTYLFHVLEHSSDRNVVQIFDWHRTKLYATVLTVPDSQQQEGAREIIKFAETAEQGPQALKEWFYPGESGGWLFVYPKSEAAQLAKASKQAVPFMPSNLTADISKPANAATDPTVMELKNAPVQAEQPDGKEVSLNQAFGPKSSTVGTDLALSQR